MGCVAFVSAFSGLTSPRAPNPRRAQSFTRFELSSVALTAKSLSEFDCVLLATDHDRFDYALIKEHARLIIDSRGRYLEPSSHIIKA